MNALSVEKICKSFGEVKAVRSLSAAVPKGSIYGFLGPNGAGKTTSIRMILSIIHPDSGSIDILGRSSASLIRERIGYLPEERGLYPKMTVRGLLTYLGVIKGVSRSKLKTEIPKWLLTVGLETRLESRVEELSRGMQQKLQFLATVIHDPDLLVFDEPFSGLDPVNLDLIKGIILGLRDEGKTIIFSTHMMHHAEELCDRMLLINRGEKIVDGPIADIRSGYESGRVRLEAEGDTGFVEGLPMVGSVSGTGGKLELRLKEGADSQELLKALADKLRIRTFEEKVPSLHEIFVDLVGRDDAQDA